MDTVMIRSGKVVALVGGLNVTPTGALINYIGVTANTTGNAKYKDSPFSTFQASVNGTGAVTATVAIQGSNDNVNWAATALGTITLSATTTASDGFTTTAPWKWVRAVVSNVTGTGAVVTVLMGV